MNTDFNMASFWYQKLVQKVKEIKINPNEYDCRMAAIAHAQYRMYIAQGTVPAKGSHHE